MSIIKKQAMWMAACLAVGTAIILATIGKGDMSVVQGTGAGLVVVSLLKLFNLYRTARDPVKMKKYQLLQNEERLISIAEKSGRLALVISLVIELLLSVYFSLTGNSYMGIMLGYLAGGQTLIYLISYYYFNKTI